VNIALLKHNIHVIYYPKAFYHYVQDENENSLVKKPKSYDERLLVKNKICQLMDNHKHYNVCYKTMVSDMVSNIFYNRQFTSNEFKEKMYQYRNVVLSNDNLSWHLRIRLYLSCLGLYGPIYTVHKMIKRNKLCQK